VSSDNTSQLLATAHSNEAKEHLLQIALVPSNTFMSALSNTCQNKQLSDAAHSKALP
jgi:hypothetical protein